MSKIACIVGASGLVGGHLLDLLSESNYYHKIIVVNRRSLDLNDDKIEEIIIHDFDNMDKKVKELTADDYFCCLGTTIKKAGSKEAFKKVDFEYVVTFAAIAKENNAQSFSVVSAMGAKVSSMIFYNQVKGEMEDAVLAIKNNKTFIFRPSLIAGERNEHRSGEQTAQWFFDKFNFLFKGPLKKYGAVKASQIAFAMLQTVQKSNASSLILMSDSIQEVK